MRTAAVVGLLAGALAVPLVWGQGEEPVTVRRDGDRWVVRNGWYETVHDARQGGSIVAVAFLRSGNRLPVTMRDSMHAHGDGYLLVQDDSPEVEVTGSEEGATWTLVVVNARLRHPKKPREECPRVTYRYVYRAGSPLIRIESLIPEQTVSQRFGRVQQFVFDFGKDNPFERADRVVTSGSGELMVTAFKWTPCEARPAAGTLLANDADAFGIITPVVATYRIDKEGMHLRSRGYLDAWMGEELRAGATLYVGPPGEVAKHLPQADCARGRSKTPRVRNRLSAIEAALSGRAAVREPVFAETDVSLGLANSHTGLVFTRTPKTVRLAGIRRKQHALLRPSPTGRALWRALARDTETKALHAVAPTRADRVEYALERPGREAAVLKLTWPAIAAGPGRIRAEVSISLRADDPLSRWRISLQPDGDRLSLWEVEFPIVAGIGRDPASRGLDYLVFPYKSGSRLPNPAAAGVWSLLYPGAAGWAFLAYWQGQDGLYVAAHDSGASVRTLKSMPTGDGTVTLSMRHPVPNMGLPGTGYDMPFECVVGTFEGDWYDATQIYRSWLTTQEWFPRKPLHANPDVPQWLKDVVVSTRRSGKGNLNNTIETHEGSTFVEYHTGVLEEHEALGKPPTLFWWYHAWHPRPGVDRKFADSPDFHAPPGFAEGVRKVKKQNIHAISYSLAHWWDYSAETWKKENAESAVIIREDGSQWLYRRRGVGIMCPAAKLYQQKMQRVMHRLLGQGPVDGTYFDLGGTAGSSHCHAKDHGHPAGSGSFPTTGKRELMRGMRHAARTRNPDFIVVMEGNADCYLDAVDGFAIFEENVPVRQALYADYCRTAGAKRCVWDRSVLEAIGPAKHFAWGGSIGRFVSHEMGDRKGGLDPRSVAYFKRLAWHKYAARPWLNLGRMLRPLKVANVDPSDPAEFVEGTMVPSGVWEAPDGAVAFVFANARHSVPVSFEYTIDPAVYGIAADGSVALFELTPEGEPPQVAPVYTRIATISGPVKRRETLAPGGTRVLVAKASGR